MIAIVTVIVVKGKVTVIKTEIVFPDLFVNLMDGGATTFAKQVPYVSLSLNFLDKSYDDKVLSFRKLAFVLIIMFVLIRTKHQKLGMGWMGRMACMLRVLWRRRDSRKN